MSKGEVSAGASLSFDDARSRSARPNESNLECRFRRTSNVIVPSHLNFTIFAGGPPFKAIRAINACKRQADPIPASSSWNGRRAPSLNFPAPGHYAAPAKRSRSRCLPFGRSLACGSKWQGCLLSRYGFGHYDRPVRFLKAAGTVDELGPLSLHDCRSVGG